MAASHYRLFNHREARCSCHNQPPINSSSPLFVNAFQLSRGCIQQDYGLSVPVVLLPALICFYTCCQLLCTYTTAVSFLIFYCGLFSNLLSVFFFSKPFPIGDRVTFSGKDCVCQQCSHKLVKSNEPIKIHGPSRKSRVCLLSLCLFCLGPPGTTTYWI